jgi:alkylated DNA repair dioxygenase AlkB
MLENLSVIVMGGHMQKEYQHTVPKVNGGKGLEVGRRINITFRQFKV